MRYENLSHLCEPTYNVAVEISIKIKWDTSPFIFITQKMFGSQRTIILSEFFYQ